MRRGQPDEAIDDLRAALDYNPNDFDYQLALARILRDTGKNNPARKSEAESYLIGLWERDPQNSLVNLAIARLYASENLIEQTLQYYHNAMYGVWPAEAASRRQQAQLELIKYLLSANAYPQAQAELINWSSELLASDTTLRLTVADLFMQAHDYDHAFSEYLEVLRHDHEEARAVAGAGQTAFQLGRYRTAQHYLSTAVQKDASDAQTKQLLTTANLILAISPYAQHISTIESARRVRTAFDLSGKRLLDCAKEKNISLTASEQPTAESTSSDSATTPSMNTLTTLYGNWLGLKPKVAMMRESASNNTRDEALDTAFEIEQQTANICGSPTGADQALLLLSQNPTGAAR